MRLALVKGISTFHRADMKAEPTCTHFRGVHDVGDIDGLSQCFEL